MQWRHVLRRAFFTNVCLALTITLALIGTSEKAQAGEPGWSFRLEPMLTTAYGHDQHVLTIHEIDSALQLSSREAVSLETESGLAFRGEARYSGGTWSWGLDITVFYTSQDTPDRTAAADGSFDQVIFDVADRSFISSDPSERLAYHVLEDTRVQTWTVDAYALRTLAEAPGRSLQLQLGLRNADFDNDYRAVVGIEDVGGRRLDASSNYDRMMGPLVGLLGSIELGKHQLEAYIGQSVLLSSVELTSMSREFAGPLTSAFDVDAGPTTTTSQETFSKTEDVAIPVTDLRLRWTYRVSRHLGLGIGANTSAWWDLPVPPGVIPGEGGDTALHETTIVYFGLLASVEWRF